ncbi:MAG: hypothetical protein ACK5P7_03150 [Bdellovibrio sp.]|jgi:hypothetical protein
MKPFLLLALMSLTTTSAFASADFFECGGFAGVDEYRSAIDLKTNKADFFDNDATSILTLKSVKSLESSPPQTLMIFEGQDAGYSGTLRLSFNLTKKKATMASIDSNGKVSEIGKANCVVAPRRDLEE